LSPISFSSAGLRTRLLLGWQLEPEGAHNSKNSLKCFIQRASEDLASYLNEIILLGILELVYVTDIIDREDSVVVDERMTKAHKQ
jgi:hypothetical protein